MLTGHPDEAADHSVTLPPLHQVPFQACFHAYVFNVWTARGTYLVPEYCKPGGFLDTSAPHLGGEQSYSFFTRFSTWNVFLFWNHRETMVISETFVRKHGPHHVQRARTF